jgi:hypothetical protein
MHGQKQDSKKYSVSTLFSYHDRQSYVIRSGKDLNRLNNIEKVTLVYVHRQRFLDTHIDIFQEKIFLGHISTFSIL